MSLRGAVSPVIERSHLPCHCEEPSPLSLRGAISPVIARSHLPCHCEEQRDEAISEIAALHSVPLAMTYRCFADGQHSERALRNPFKIHMLPMFSHNLSAFWYKLGMKLFLSQYVPENRYECVNILFCNDQRRKQSDNALSHTAYQKTLFQAFCVYGFSHRL